MTRAWVSEVGPSVCDAECGVCEVPFAESSKAGIRIKRLPAR